MKKIYLKRIVAIVAVLILSLGVMTGCGGNSESTLSDTGKEKEGDSLADTSSDEEIVIRVADFQTAVWNSQFKVAYVNGLFDEAFKDQNVKVEVINFANGPAVNEAFIAGEIDIVNGIGDQPIVIGMGNEVDTAVLAGAARQGENIGIIASKESGITTAADLKGKKIGVFIGTYVHKSLIGILDDAGISEDEVEVVNITSTADADAAFASGDIDAYLSQNGAHIQDNVESGNFVKIADCENHPAYSYIVASNSFVSDHQDIVKTFLEVLYQAEQWINENPEEAYQLIADFSEQDVDWVEKTIKDAKVSIALEDDWIENFNITYDFLLSHDMITTELTADDISEHIDTSILDEVLAK